MVIGFLNLRNLIELGFLLGVLLTFIRARIEMVLLYIELLRHLVDLLGLLERLLGQRFDGEFFMVVHWFKRIVLIIIMDFEVHVTIIIIYRIKSYAKNFKFDTGERKPLSNVLQTILRAPMLD